MGEGRLACCLDEAAIEAHEGIGEADDPHVGGGFGDGTSHHGAGDGGVLVVVSEGYDSKGWRAAEACPAVDEDTPGGMHPEQCKEGRDMAVCGGLGLTVEGGCIVRVIEDERQDGAIRVDVDRLPGG
jgi:hypothetical protein